jgi:hypothetical protein
MGVYFNIFLLTRVIVPTPFPDAGRLTGEQIWTESVSILTGAAL